MKFDPKGTFIFFLVLVGLYFLPTLIDSLGDEKASSGLRQFDTPRRSTSSSGSTRTRDRSVSLTDQALGPSFVVSLERISSQCGWTPRDASAKLRRMQQMLREDGENVELQDLASGLDQASRGSRTDCHQLLATLGAMLTVE